MIKLGKTARFVREREGLTQREAARLLKISEVHLSNIENNKAIPSEDVVDRYRRLWDVDLHVAAWCLFGKPESLPEPLRRPALQLAKAWKQRLGLDQDSVSAVETACSS